MRIGELAAQAQVNIQTIRFYERRRVLDAPPRTAGGYRIYGARDLENLIFIRQAQELGFSLREITKLARMHRAASTPATPSESRFREQRQMAQFARARLEDLDHKLRAMRTMRLRLASLIDKLETTTTVRCPGHAMRE